MFDEIAEGKVGAPVQLRKGDCFENLAGSITRANATLAQSIMDLKTTAAALSKRADALADRELKEQVTALNRLLTRYEIVKEAPAVPVSEPVTALP